MVVIEVYMDTGAQGVRDLMVVEFSLLNRSQFIAWAPRTPYRTNYRIIPFIVASLHAEFGRRQAYSVVPKSRELG